MHKMGQLRSLACFQQGSPLLQEASEGRKPCARPHHDHWGAHLLRQLKVGMPHKDRYPLSCTGQQCTCLQLYTSKFPCIQSNTSHHVTSHHITSHHITPHHITSHHLTPHHVTSNHITSHHIISHHITSHHITSHHITSQQAEHNASTAQLT